MLLLQQVCTSEGKFDVVVEISLHNSSPCSLKRLEVSATRSIISLRSSSDALTCLRIRCDDFIKVLNRRLKYSICLDCSSSSLCKKSRWDGENSYVFIQSYQDGKVTKATVQKADGVFTNEEKWRDLVFLNPRLKILMVKVTHEKNWKNKIKMK